MQLSTSSLSPNDRMQCKGKISQTGSEASVAVRALARVLIRIWQTATL
jgi:hypothetical protein